MDKGLTVWDTVWIIVFFSITNLNLAVGLHGISSRLAPAPACVKTESVQPSAPTKPTKQAEI